GRLPQRPRGRSALDPARQAAREGVGRGGLLHTRHGRLQDLQARPRPLRLRSLGMKLENRVAIVTGAAQGIGKAIAEQLAAKGGVVGLTRALATELGKYGITANAVAPGITRSPATLNSPHQEAFDFVQALQAIPRHAEPQDIAPAVAFLASEESGWVTGQVIVADAGHIRD